MTLTPEEFRTELEGRLRRAKVSCVKYTRDPYDHEPDPADQHALTIATKVYAESVGKLKEEHSRELRAQAAASHLGGRQSRDEEMAKLTGALEEAKTLRDVAEKENGKAWQRLYRMQEDRERVLGQRNRLKEARIARMVRGEIDAAWDQSAQLQELREEIATIKAGHEARMKSLRSAHEAEMALWVRERDEARAEVERLQAIATERFYLVDNADRAAEGYRLEVERLKGENQQWNEKWKGQVDLYVHASQQLASYKRVNLELIEFNGKLHARLALAEKLLRRLHGWDHMDTAGDGSYWRREIDAFISSREPAPQPETEKPCNQIDHEFDCHVVIVSGVPCCGCAGRVHAAPGPMGDGRDGSYPIAEPPAPQDHAESILAATDEQLLEEVKRAGLDPVVVAEETRAVLLGAVDKFKQRDKAPQDHAALAEALRKAAEKFREYERIHRDKLQACRSFASRSRGQAPKDVGVSGQCPRCDEAACICEWEICKNCGRQRSEHRIIAQSIHDKAALNREMAEMCEKALAAYDREAAEKKS